MRNPRTSNHNIPGHKSLGPQLTKIIVQFLFERPRVMKDILEAVGKPKGEANGQDLRISLNAAIALRASSTQTRRTTQD